MVSRERAKKALEPAEVDVIVDVGGCGRACVMSGRSVGKDA